MTEQQAQADPFADGEDPFANSGPEPDMADPADEVAAESAEADIPTVDREGNRVEPEAEEQASGDGAPEAPQEAPEAPQEAEEPQGQADVQDGEPEAQADEEGDGEEEKEPSGPKTPIRYYRLMYQTADNQWTEVDVSNVRDLGVETETTREKGLGQVTWIKARNNDHALRIAWVILGRPAEGVRAWPVPRGSFKPKLLRPKPPQPARESLEIV